MPLDWRVLSLEICRCGVRVWHRSGDPSPPCLKSVSVGHIDSPAARPRSYLALPYPAHSLTVTSGNIVLLSGYRLQRFTDTGNTVSRRVGNLCKTRWSNIRDNYRKSLRRIATKPLQDSNKIKKYKYAGALTFLDAYFQVREPISSITTEDNIEEEEEENTTLQETEYFDIGTINTVEVKNEVNEDCNECQETQKRPWPKKMAHTQKRKCQQPQTSASIPMNSLIEEKNKTEPQVHSVDAFLAAIAQTLKTFTPYYLNVAKTKIFAIVQEYEMEMILEKTTPIQSLSSAPST
uniref:(California timema) hypothetical protein n=1 Tax=Timema californicum TaxID=61474 RepID=A0A7R9J507_TIMCA|nr:unnamed protein product [Timema californicum]